MYDFFSKKSTVSQSKHLENGDKIRIFHKHIEKRRNGENAVKTVENSAVSGEDLAIILYVVIALDSRRRKVAKLGYDRDESADESDYHIVRHNVFEPCDYHRIKHEEKRTEKNARNRTFNSLFWADFWAKLVSAEKSAAKISKNVCYPGADEDKHIYIVAKYLRIS